MNGDVRVFGDFNYFFFQILLFTFSIALTCVDRIYAENKQSISTAEFLSVLAKNVATVLSPTLVGELQDGRPNRTALNATIILPITIATTQPSKGPETTTESSKLSSLEADTVRSAQTQSEVRPGGNHGYPFNYDDNNYRYNYPAVNPQGYPIRQDFQSGPFVNPAYYNVDPYRSYPGQTEGNLPRGENVAGVSPVETLADGQTGRSPESQDPSSQNFERFRNFERFTLNNQFPSGPGPFNNIPFTPQRTDGRFGQSLIDAFPQNPLNNQNFAANPNYQNSILNNNNNPRNSFQTTGDPFQQRQQTFRSNNFDFLPSQRFQNPFENYPRSLQRGPNFPGFFPLIHANGQTENFVSPTTRIDEKRIKDVTTSEIRAKSDIVGTENGAKSSSNETTTTTEDPIISVQGQIRFGRLILPALEDYSDLRFRPDAFREYLFTPNENTKKNKTNNAAAANDI